MFEIEKILRQNIKNLMPYSSARDEYKGSEGVFLDANENAFGSPIEDNYNRYPDPMQWPLKEKVSQMKGIAAANIFIGNGSDEAIDLLFRAFCNPEIDNVIICPPTYGMYEVSANINNVPKIKIPLKEEDFQLDTKSILAMINENTKLIFICSPNNPTGNDIKWQDIKTVLDRFKGIVVVDEAYIDFSSSPSLIPELKNYPNLVILQTFSKAWGLAGLRLGMAFASEEIIAILNKIKPPYNINAISQKLALEALDNNTKIAQWIKTTTLERENLSLELQKLKYVLKVYPSDANFILVKVEAAETLYNYLISNKIIIRDRSKVTLCEGCVRITIGTPEENLTLLTVLKKYV